VVRPEIERHAKLPFDIVESFDKPISDFSVQELDTAVACRTIAVPPPGAPIEQHQWEIVGSGHRGEVAGLG
jgi:hypothetical protein